MTKFVAEIWQDVLDGVALPADMKMGETLAYYLARVVPRHPNGATIPDYEEAIADKERLTKELNTILGGTAEKPSLCDVVAYVAMMLRESGPVQVVSLEGGDTKPVTLYKTPFQIEPVIPSGYWLAPDELPTEICAEVDMFPRILAQRFWREAKRLYLKSKLLVNDRNKG